MRFGLALAVRNPHAFCVSRTAKLLGFALLLSLGWCASSCSPEALQRPSRPS